MAGPFDDIQDNPFGDIEAPKTSVGRRIADVGLSVAKGVVGLGEAAVGVGDIVSGGGAGNALARLGYNPSATKKAIDEYMSPAGLADAQAVAETKGFLPTVAEVASRPWHVGNILGESAPSILGGGAVGRIAQKSLGAAAFPVGEGVVSAGSTAEQIRQETGTLNMPQTAAAVGSGAAVAALGGIGQAASRFVKGADPDSLLAKGLGTIEGNRFARAGKGAVVEGAEETVQSGVEQAAGNYGTGKPLGEGVPEAMGTGLVAGAAMGAGVNLARGADVKEQKDQKPPQQTQNNPAVQAPPGPLQAAAAVGAATGATAAAPGAAQPQQGGVRGLISAAAQKNGVDPNTALVIASIETGGRFNADAQNPRSSANGVFQFMDATRKMFPEVTPEMWKDPQVQADYGAKFIAQTNQRLAASLGRVPTTGEAYMGHLLGAFGAQSLLKADPNAAVQDVIAQYDPKRAAEIVRLNGMKGLTAGQAIEKWTSIADQHAKRLGVEQAAFPFSDKAAAQMQATAAAREGRMLEVVEHPNVPGRFAALPPLAGDPNEEQPASKVPLIADLPRYDEDPAAPPAQALQAEAQGQAIPAADAAGLPTAGNEAAAPVPLAVGADPGAVPATDEVDALDDPAVQHALQQELQQELRHQPGVHYNAQPTEPQKKAGNYLKAHESFEGSSLTFENPIGSTRSGTDPDGNQWSSKMTEADYGYEKRTKGADGDHVDVYLARERTPNAPVFVIDQMDPETGNFDEHKVIQGAATRERAVEIYESSFSDQSGPLRMGTISQMSRPEYRTWLGSGTTETTPASVVQPDVQAQRAIADGIIPQETDDLTDEPFFKGVPDAAKWARDLQVAVAQPQALKDDDVAATTDLNAALEQAGFAPVAPLRSAPQAEAAMVAAVAERAFGKRVIHVEGAEGFSGVAFKDRIYLSANETRPAAFTIGHEVAHTVEGRKVHAVLRDVFRTYGMNPEQQVAERQAMEQASDQRAISRKYAENEMIADMNGSMWVDPKFWSELARRDESVFRTVAYKFMEVATRVKRFVTGTQIDASNILKDVDSARYAIAQAWADHLQQRKRGKATATPQEALFTKESRDEGIGHFNMKADPSGDGKWDGLQHSSGAYIQKNPMSGWYDAFMADGTPIEKGAGRNIESAQRAALTAAAARIDAFETMRDRTNGQPKFAKDWPPAGMTVWEPESAADQPANAVGNPFGGLMPKQPPKSTTPVYSKRTAPDTPEFKAFFGKSSANPLVTNPDGTPRVMFHGTARDITKFKAKQAGAIFITPTPRFAADFADASENYMWEHQLGELSGEQRAEAKRRAIEDVKADSAQFDVDPSMMHKAIEDIENDNVSNAAAMDFLRPHILNQMPTRGNSMPLWVRAENTFDYENPDHVQWVVDDLNRETDRYGRRKGSAYFGELRRGDWETIEGKVVQQALKNLGFDSFTVYEGGTKNLAVYEPSQLKSAIGNSGEFSRKNDDLRFSKLPPVELPDKLFKSLTVPERAKIRRDVATRLVALFDQLPSAKEFAAVAWAGKAARGWYADSAMAIRHVFGPDANRFTALLAAMSPQTSVQSNLQNAAAVWAGWVKAGRPTKRDEIIQIMGQNVQGNNLTDSVLDAWINNSVRALSTEDPENLVISGPKVNSFMQNLRGNVEEVTNDAWMASFAAVDQKIFAGSLTKGGNPGKGTGYLGMSARVREAAATLSKLTGEKWTPAEVQETIWSWAKTLYELQEDREGGYGAREIIDNGELRDEMIAATPEFSSLLLDDKYAKGLRNAGYAERIDGLRSLPSTRGSAAAVGGKTPPFAAEAQRKYERAAANRLEELRDARARGEAETRASKKELGADFALSKLPNQTIFEVAPDPRNAALKEQWDALPAARKWDISAKVGGEIGNKAMSALGLTGSMRQQMGGYGPDSNPSLAFVFDEKADPAKIDALTRVMGSALSQQSMMRTSPAPFDGSFEMNAIVVEFPKNFSDEQVHELYTQIRTIADDKGEAYATGHTTASGSMVILDDGSRISADDFVAKIDALLGEPFNVSHDTIHAAFPEAGENDYGFQGEQDGKSGQTTAGEDGSEPSVRQAAGELRAEAQRRLRQEVAAGQARAAAADQEVVRFAKAFGPALKDVSVPAIKGRIKGKWTDLRSIALQALGGRQLAEIYAPDLPQLPQYQKLVQLMQAGVNDMAATADKVVSDWGRVKDEGALADLMHDSTLRQIDPSKPYVAGDSQSTYDELRARWDAASPEAKAIFTTARDMYEEHYAQVRAAIRERIERAEGMSTAKKSEMLTRMDGQFFERIKGVYFPLARFGDYVVIVRDEAGKTAAVSRAETKHEADRLREELKGDFGPGYTVSAVIRAAEFNAKRDAVGSEFLEKLFSVLDQTGLGEDLQDDINQLVLSSMPDLSWAKHGIHRKGTAGFSKDARRAFAQNMFHGARYLQRVRFGDRLEHKLREAEKYVKGRNELTESVKAQQVLNEVRKRHENLMNPVSHPAAQALTSFGFFFHLGLSPASALVNLTQTPMVAFPVIGGKFGMGRAASALIAASKDTMSAKNDLTQTLQGEELKAVQQAIDEGTIDVTLAHDLAGIAQGNDSELSWKLRPAMRAASFMFHHAERFNRQATFLAAFRLARAGGADFEAAVDTASELTYTSHFDYTSANRPRVMQGDVAKVVTQFKQYAQNMIFLLADSTRKSLQGDTQALRTLGGLLTMSAMAAGALGVPLVSQLLSLASMLGGDDDEPWDAKVALQNYLADTLGQKPAEMLMHGLSRSGPADISGRVSLDVGKMLFPDVNEALEGAEWYTQFATGLLGPVIGGVGVNAAKAMQHLGDGDYVRAIESLAPSVVRGPVKAARYASEGVVNKDGTVLKDDVSVGGLAAQAAGFRPSEVANAQEGRGAILSLDKRLDARRGDLMAAFAKAAMAGGDTSDAVAAIQKWNQSQPTRVIGAMHIQASIQTRAKRIATAEQGVSLKASERDLLQQGRFAVEQP